MANPFDCSNTALNPFTQLYADMRLKSLRTDNDEASTTAAAQTLTPATVASSMSSAVAPILSLFGNDGFASPTEQQVLSNIACSPGYSETEQRLLDIAAQSKVQLKPTELMMLRNIRA